MAGPSASPPPDAGVPESGLRVEVVYALPRQQQVVTVTLPVGSVVADAVMRSGLLERFPDIELSRVEVGVFGEKVPLDRPLSPDDRVEIYRRLEVSPEQARRLRAAARRGQRPR